MSPSSEARTRAIVLCPISSQTDPENDPEFRLEEADGLARALDLQVVDSAIVTVRKISASTYVSATLIDALRERCEAEEVGVIVFNGALSPVQQRNLELQCKAKVLDRTGLILEIFSMRARTREGRVQVELARIQYERSRLVRTWTHLERQRGGRGFLAGPGERQIESDRRMLRSREHLLKGQLKEIRKTRSLHRQARKRHRMPVIALVGYTNAGKSTLFNRLTGSSILAKDMLFATLDPTMRQITLPLAGIALLSDTVGFISDLPTELVAAFRATLEEVVEADLILHVRDIASEQTDLQARNVNEIVASLLSGADRPPQIMECFNKADLLDEEGRQWWSYQAGKVQEKTGKSVLVSAETGEGMEELLDLIAGQLYGPVETRQIQITHDKMSDMDWLRQNANIERFESDPGNPTAINCTVQIRRDLWVRFRGAKSQKIA